MRTFPELLLLAVCCATPVVAAAEPTFAGATFEAATAPRAIAAADFNRDGRLDLATAGRDGIEVLLNRDGRIFNSRYASTRSGAGAFDMAAGDLNRDGVADLVVAQADAHAVDIYIGRGDGTFVDPRRIAITGGNPRGLTLVDYDRNGTLDIIVTEYATAAWRILHGDGKGAIARQERFSSIANPQGVAAADFNRDGRPDVAIAGAGASRVALFLSTPTGGFVQRNVTVGAAVNVIATGDFNGDGWIDLAAASTGSSRIYTLRGGTTGLTWTGTITSGSSPRGIAAADVDQDGRLDLITANRASNAVNVHLGSATGTFGTARRVPAGSGSRAVAAGDFDHDGRMDLATIDEFASSTTVLSNTTAFVAPAFRFTRQTFDTLPGVGGPFGVRTGDFDRNGRMDAIVWSSGIDIRLAGRTTTTMASVFVNDVTVADFNRDGAPDFAASDLFEERVRVYINRGDGTFTEGQPAALGARAIHLASADFNRDGRADIIYQDVEDGSVMGVFHVVLGKGDGTFTAVSTTSEPMPYVQQIAIADMDRDGNPDVVGSSASPPNFVVWYGKGDGTSSRLVTYGMPLGIPDLALADFNEDGLMDVASAYENLVYVRLGLPGGDLAPVTEHPATLRSDGAFVYDIAVGDINLDGHIDVVTNDVDILFGKGDGTFRFDARSGFEGYYQDPVVADYNADGLPDLLFNDGGGLVVMLNERGGTNRAPTASAGPDRRVSYLATNGFGDDFSIDAIGTDPDLHELRYEWRDASGKVVATGQFFQPTNLPAGTYTFTVTVDDGRGGKASDSMVLTVGHLEEIYLNTFHFDNGHGAWETQDDASASGDRVIRHANANAPKLTAPLANPENYFEGVIPAEPTQTYKLWIRLKADANHWANDSVFVQFEGATDATGKPIYQIGSTSALEVNLEECSGCGISGWGWEDDGWGAINRTGSARLRFPNGVGRIRIQTREDGVAIDQVVLSSKRFLTTRPGTAKNDTTILPITVPLED